MAKGLSSFLDFLFALKKNKSAKNISWNDR